MLRLSNIHKTFEKGSVSEKMALQGLSLEVPDGDFVTIIGSNGAGKSTLFNLIAGKFYPDHGNVTLDSVDITFTPDYKRSRSIGYLFQDPHGGTAPHMTILENLTLASSEGKKSKEYYKERLSSLELGLENRLSERVGSLSGGERQALTLL
ncbi:MAG: ATP-binding cassette domain-containing protein, partial [Oscillospiraceae bacterium]